uniref:Uncharacterized protein n=1 Tax=Physcomitrium patens TaxID=3218 RepID=A0A7I4BJZ1_PHYPA
MPSHPYSVLLELLPTSQLASQRAYSIQPSSPSPSSGTSSPHPVVFGVARHFQASGAGCLRSE